MPVSSSTVSNTSSGGCLYYRRQTAPLFRRRAHAVLSAPSVVLSVHPAVFDMRSYRIALKIVRRIRRFLRHHIDMRLQNHPSFMFHACADGGFIQINIAFFVQTQRVGQFHFRSMRTCALTFIRMLSV